MRILDVEDDPRVREFVVETLRDEGYDVVPASNGEEALAWCKRQVADVLVTISGCGTGRRLADTRALPRA